jgi:hypothetical protein
VRWGRGVGDCALFNGSSKEATLKEQRTENPRAVDRARILQWVERDEADFGRCVTPADFATQYARINQADADSIAAPLSARQEAARRGVLAQLEAHPSVDRTFVNRFEDGVLVVTLAIRGVETGELKIPAARFDQDTLDDYGALLNTIKGRRHD